MTEYSDWKLDPTLSDIVTEVAEEQYGEDFRAKSRAGHEALVAWLVLRADDDVVQDVLQNPAKYDEGLAADLDRHDIDSVSELVRYLAEGRFDGDDQFDPLASVRTPDEVSPDA